jgi:hypothetical protein
MIFKPQLSISSIVPLAGSIQVALRDTQEAASRLQAAGSDVSNGLTQLARLLPETPTPGGLREQYPALYAHMARDWEKMQQAASVSPLSCVQLGTVGVDLGTINVDLGSIHVEDGTFAVVRTSVGYAVNQVRSGATTIQTWAPVYDSRARLYARLMGRTPPQSIAAQATNWASKALSSLEPYRDRWNAASALKTTTTVVPNR